MGKKLLTPSNLKSVRFELSGLDDYLKKVQAAGRNIEEAVAEAIAASPSPIRADIQAWAEKHKLTGTMLEGVDVSDVQQEGNFIFVEVGINDDKSKGAWHAVFTEYGTPTQPADPGIRQAFENNKGIVKKIQKSILAKAGVPIE